MTRYRFAEVSSALREHWGLALYRGVPASHSTSPDGRHPEEHAERALDHRCDQAAADWTGWTGPMLTAEPRHSATFLWQPTSRVPHPHAVLGEERDPRRIDRVRVHVERLGWIDRRSVVRDPAVGATWFHDRLLRSRYLLHQPLNATRMDS